MSKTPILKENKKDLKKEIDEINDRIKSTEEGNNRIQEIIKKV